MMMFFAISHFPSPSFIVAVKCGISLATSILFALFMLRESGLRTEVQCNLREKSTYLHVLVLGVFKEVIPYLLIAYSVQYLPITLVGVLMVVTPWWVIFIQTGVLKQNIRLTHLLRVGMIMGLSGILLMIITILIETGRCDGAVHPANTTNVSLMHVNIIPNGLKEDMDITWTYCHSYKDIFSALFAIILVPVCWAVVEVFLKRKNSSMHFIAECVGEYVVASIISITIWLISESIFSHQSVSNKRQWILYVLYLGVATGWFASFLHHSLFTKLGNKVINQVFIGLPLITLLEDYIFIHDNLKTHTYAVVMNIISTFLVSAGIFISTIHNDEEYCGSVQYINLTEPLLQCDAPCSASDEELKSHIYRYGERMFEDDESEEGTNTPTLSEVSIPSFPLPVYEK